jgi:hypothetical protein
MDSKYLSVNDFKNWLSEHKDTSDFFFGQNPENPNDKYIGMAVRSKVSGKKLLEKIETEYASSQQLVTEFVNGGGSVLGVEPKRVLIETESGEFYLPRFCVKITKD